ncbi:G-type lectin S-receptor-like serine/threonine-protein kinase [Abeliophyllum distichum]|uniref:G-type lectin S-receptor-like serine/threonine-protein kinase n=1 Tax=Abeliophyllum distichum TaxID=126358 RepID=A0ABD1QEJ1_9LAMI
MAENMHTCQVDFSIIPETHGRLNDDGSVYNNFSNEFNVANRDFPLTSTSGILKVIKPGLLVLLNNTNNIVWSSNASKSVQTPVARLLNSGNLVVKDANDDKPDNFLWQSFDHPTDTYLPGMKLGWNFITGKETYISSWKTNEDPAPGDFTFRLDPTGYPQYFMRRGTLEYYGQGPWNGLFFSGSPNARQNPTYTFGLFMNKNEVYFWEKAIDRSVISRCRVSPSGVGQRWTWVDRNQDWVSYSYVPLDNCDTYKLCGAYGSCNIGDSPLCGCLSRLCLKIHKTGLGQIGHRRPALLVEEKQQRSGAALLDGTRPALLSGCGAAAGASIGCGAAAGGGGGGGG